MNFHVNFDKKEDSPIIPHRNLTMEFISLFTWQRQDFKRAAILQTHGSPRDNWVASHTRISLCFGSPTNSNTMIIYLYVISNPFEVTFSFFFDGNTTFFQESKYQVCCLRYFPIILSWFGWICLWIIFLWMWLIILNTYIVGVLSLATFTRK